MTDNQETGSEDRFALGYAAAKRHYQREDSLYERAAVAWRESGQDRGREVIRSAWPSLAGALDALAAEADAMADRPR